MTELLTCGPTQRAGAGRAREAGGSVVGPGAAWGIA